MRRGPDLMRRDPDLTGKGSGSRSGGSGSQREGIGISIGRIRISTRRDRDLDRESPNLSGKGSAFAASMSRGSLAAPVWHRLSSLCPAGTGAQAGKPVLHGSTDLCGIGTILPGMMTAVLLVAAMAVHFGTPLRAGGAA